MKLSTVGRKFSKAAALIALSAGLVACSDGDKVRLFSDDGEVQTVNGEELEGAGDTPIVVDDGTPTGNSITDTAVAAGDFTLLVAALQATGLDSVLADESKTFTVFAPNDAAFEKLGQDTINALLNDTETLTDILLYHVVSDAAVDAATAVSLAGTTVEATNGDKFAVTLDGDKLFVNTSEVIATDIMASNGIIHVIDTVLLPPEDVTETPLVSVYDTAVAADDFNLLVATLEATGLDATLADETKTFTVFAPTDAAFTALGTDTINALLADPDTLSNILLYHVIADTAVDSATAISLSGSSVATANGAEIKLAVRDGNLFINESMVTATDIQASNGVIHVIDAVLSPPAPQPEEPVTEPVTGTILEVAEEAGFTTLVAAVKVAGLDGALGHPGDLYTVFAPTDEAFAALGSETIEALLADPDTLRDILLYHVLPGTVVDSVAAADLVGFDVQSGNGQSIKLSTRDGALMVNEATIIAADVEAVNGVIHVIDQVLLPPSH